MNEESVNEGKQILSALSGSNAELTKHVEKKLAMATVNNPVAELEFALVDFVKDAMVKIKAENEYQEAIKDQILSMLNEFDPDQLLRALSQSQQNTTAATEKLLALFVNQGGEGGGLLSSGSGGNSNGASSEEMLFDKVDDYKLLQTLQGLTTAIDQANKIKNVINVTPS